MTRRPALGLLVVALAAFVMIGLIDGSLGVAWPSIRDVFDRSVADLGLLLVFGSAGYLSASVGYGWLHARFGTGVLLGSGATLLTVALTGVALAPVWPLVVISVVVLGFGGALVDTGMNAYAALAFDVRSMNLLHACYGVGATLGPVAITISLVSSGVWRVGYLALAVLQTLAAVTIWGRRWSWASAESEVTSGHIATTRISQVWILILVFFLYTGVEVGTGQWAFTLLTESRGVQTAAAGTWVAVYWAGLTVGRFGFGIIGHRLVPARILNGSMVVILAGLGILWLDPSGFGVIGLPIAGLGLAAVFPTLVSLTPARIGHLRSTRSVGFQMAAASAGASGIPWVLGLAAAARGLETLAAGLFVTAVLLAAVYLISERLAAHHYSPHKSPSREMSVPTPKLNPPFRADHVGSLLRPPEVHVARQQHADGKLTADGLRQVEDQAIAAMIPELEATGIRAITDGEYRRAWFHLDFLQQLEGVTVTGVIASSSGSESTVGMAPPRVTVTGKLGHKHDIQVEDYRFVATHTDRYPKVCIPSPTMAHFRGGRAGIDIESYPDLDVFFEDLAQVYRDEISNLYAAGCRYLQLDDTNLAYLCDPKMRQGAVERGDDPDELPRTYAQLINAAIRDVPDDMTTAVHLCRGNYKSTFFASGGYEPVAEVLFNELDVDAYFLEYDDERSGDFAPLRFVRPDKTVVLGLVTSKTPEMESEDDLLARIEDASRYVTADQLCLSPQCGFASTMEGNKLTEDEQWAKLRLVVSAAERAWG